MRQFFNTYLHDRGFRAGVNYLTITLCGFVAIGVAWRGAASKIAVEAQVPFVVSGGIGGLALVGIGIGLFIINYERRSAATHQSLIDDATNETVELSARVVALVARNSTDGNHLTTME